MTGACEECKKKKNPGLQTKSRNGGQFGQVRSQIMPQTHVPASNRQLSSQQPDVNVNKPIEVPSIIPEVLSSSGQPLDPTARAFFEPRFGFDFSQVRVHNDAKAAESARSVNALAYTVGRDVVFDTGQYAVGNSTGRQLLAHELTHVVQQAGGAGRLSRQSLALAGPSDAAEQEADRVAQQLGGPVSVASPSFSIHRQPAQPSFGYAAPQTDNFKLKLDPKIEAEMLALCAQGKLDPIRCAEMRLARGEKPPTPDSGQKVDEMEKACDIRGLCSFQKLLPTAIPKERIRAAAQRCFPDPLQYFGQDVCSLPKFDPSKFGIVLPPSNQTACPNGPTAATGLPPLNTPVGPLACPSTPSAAPSSKTPSLSDLLTFDFKAGPVQFSVELPKSATVKLPVKISAAKTLTFELQAESSKTFSFKVSLDGNQHFNVALKSSISFDDSKGSSGSAGLEIESSRKVCQADNPEELKAKVTKAGEDLKKAYAEFNAATTNEDKLKKAVDLASAIGDMYDAVDKSKKACKDTPAVKAEFGVKVPIKQTDEALKETDPTKRLSPYVGGTITLYF